MLIRSQTKTILANTDIGNIYIIDDISYTQGNTNRVVDIQRKNICISTYQSFLCLGIYESMRRAVEIIDMIQDALLNKEEVFNMPNI